MSKEKIEFMTDQPFNNHGDIIRVVTFEMLPNKLKMNGELNLWHSMMS
ncbi:hypothetical protein [Virgibacillus phasianinus]|nr:hypothetical protein [Virgibacillus phasianinus]